MEKNSHQYFDYFNVQVELCLYSIRNKKTNQVRLFLYFKSNSNGYLKNQREVYQRAAVSLNNNIKTIYKHLNWLIQEGWIIPDLKVNSIRIISFEKLARKLGFLSTKGAVLYKIDIRNFKSFAIAAVIQYNMMRNKRRNYQAGLKMRSPQLREIPPYPHLTHNYLAKILNKSKTAISRYKKLSCRQKFLKCEKKYENLDIPSFHFNNLKEFGPYESGKLLKKSGTILRQLTDKIECSIKLRNKCNLREVCRKNRNEKKAEPSY